MKVTPRRLFRLWALYGYLDVAWMLRDLGSFVTYMISDVTGIVAAVSAMFLLATRFQGVGVWTQDQILFLLGYAIMVSGAVETLFGYNVAFISRRIGRGQLDHVLVQPQPLWVTLLTEGFSPCAGLPVAVPGVILTVVALWRLQLPLSVPWLALLVLNLAASCFIVLAFSYVVGSLAFWAPRAAEEINSASMRLIVQLRSFPLDGVGAMLLGGLLTAVPVAFVAWFPSRALLGLETAPGAVFVTPLAALLAGAVALIVFSRGMTHYLATGSQRYLSYGHRR